MIILFEVSLLLSLHLFKVIQTTCLHWRLSFFRFSSEHDECLSGLHNCDENALCFNMVGGHSCSCKPGYTGNGTVCKGRHFKTVNQTIWGAFKNWNIGIFSTNFLLKPKFDPFGTFYQTRDFCSQCYGTWMWLQAHILVVQIISQLTLGEGMVHPGQGASS